jgi:hypothetical protein
VERAVEAAQLHRMVAVEKRMKVAKMIPALMVMGFAAALVSCVPDALDLGEGGWLGAVHGSHQVLVHLLAIPCPLGFDAKGLVEQVVSGMDDVHEVSDRARCVGRSVEMDVDAAGAVGERSGLSERPDDLLQVLDVGLVGEDRADQLDAVQP